MTTSSAENEGQGRLERLMAEYLHACDAGRPCDTEEIVRRNPELADELRTFFANRRAVERLVEPLRGAVLDTPTVVQPRERFESAGSRRIRYVGDY